MTKYESSFFSDVYTYYMRGGYWCILLDNICNIFITAGTLIFFTFLCFFLDWDSIGSCNSSETCKNISQYIVKPTSFHPTGITACMFIFIVMFFIYWLWMTIVMIGELIRFKKYERYFSNQLGIKSTEMMVLSWNDIIKKLILIDNNLTTKIIVGSIMKKENYLIAIISSNILEINPKFYTTSFLWVVNICILNQIFHKTDQIGITETDHVRINKLLKIFGILQLLLLPFTLIIMIVNYIINFTVDFYTKKSYIGPKEWNVYAKLLFREYNELSHIFNDRITKSYQYAIQYEQKFNAHMTNIIMEKIIFVFGSYLTILVILTFYDERLLIYITLFDRNLLWYVAILTSIISIARMMMVYPSTIDNSSEEIMTKMSEYTHYYPDKWKAKCHQKNVLKDFRQLYEYKIVNVFFEIISIIVIPFYMLCKLSTDISIIVNFVENNTKYDDNIGSICKFSLIDDDNIYNNIEDSDGMNIRDTDVFVGNYKIDDNNKIKRSQKNFFSYYSEVINSSVANADVL